MLGVFSTFRKNSFHKMVYILNTYRLMVLIGGFIYSARGMRSLAFFFLSRFMNLK